MFKQQKQIRFHWAQTTFVTKQVTKCHTTLNAE